MHPSFIFLALISIVLIIIMLACFICFTKSRRKEERELMEQVQYTTDQTRQLSQQHMDQVNQLTVTPMRNPSNSPMISGGAGQAVNQQQMEALDSDEQRDFNEQARLQMHRESRTNNNNNHSNHKHHHRKQHNSNNDADVDLNDASTYAYSSPGQQQQQQQDQMMVNMADYRAQNSPRQAQPYISVNASPYHQASSTSQMTETRNDITQQINSAIIGSTEAEFQNDFIQVFPMYQIAPLPEKNTTPYLA